MSDAYHSRFNGLQRLYGKQSYTHLKDIHIAVVGLGGVGSWAVEALARTGIGHITMIDYDTIAESNINRQLPALTSTIGDKKSYTLKSRCEQINPDIQCHVIDDFINRDNIRNYLSPEHHYDYVIDAIDSIAFKAAIIYQCKRNKIPVITTGGAGGITDPSMIHISDLSKTYNDALAAKVRSKLRKDYNFSKNTKRSFGVECIFSSQQKVYPKDSGEVSHDKPGIHGVHLDCRFGYGSVSYITSVFGMMAASRAVNNSLKKRSHG